MDKGYYTDQQFHSLVVSVQSQSTIKMDKGYYCLVGNPQVTLLAVAIHNKNGQGLLRIFSNYFGNSATIVAIHNKNGQGLLPYGARTAIKRIT